MANKEFTNMCENVKEVISRFECKGMNCKYNATKGKICYYSGSTMNGVIVCFSEDARSESLIPKKEGYFLFRENRHNDFEPVNVVMNANGILWVRHFNGLSWRIDVQDPENEWGGEIQW